MAHSEAQLIEEVISIPAPPQPAAEASALVGDWYHPGWHIKMVPAAEAPADTRLPMQWVSNPLRPRVFFGPNHAVDGRIVDGSRIEWANGGVWYKDSPLYAREVRFYSQNCEDGVLLALLDALGVSRPWALEFGVENGVECNTRILRERGGKVLQWDQHGHNPAAGLFREKVTLENIPDLIKRYEVPRDLDVLSIDVDYHDLYFWWRISQFVSPRIVVIEYNSSWGPTADHVVPYEGPDQAWDGTNYFGASLAALNRLAQRLGYVLVYCESRGVNAFFVRREDYEKVRALAPKAGDVAHIFRGPLYGAHGHPPDPQQRSFTTVASMLSAPRRIWDPG